VKYILDTHVWLWSLIEPRELSPAVVRALRDPANYIWLSPVSIWETLLLAERGRLDLRPTPQSWIEEAQRVLPTRDAPVTREVAVESRRLDLSHEDPADRFIAATAVVYGLTLVTADTRLLGSRRYQTLANRKRR
jgi:PIN domain nuclease of toxin-antitoxin system